MKKLIFALFTIFTITSNAQLYCDSVPDLEPTLPDTVCFYGPFTLDASSVTNYDSYTWQDGTSTPTYNVTAPGTYMCTVVMNTGNIVVNGDFELGNTGIFSDYGDVTGNYVIPGNTSSGLYPEGFYAIGTNPNDYHDFWSGSTHDHTTGSGNMMIVNGDTTSNSHIWCQTIDVGANGDYVFSAWLTSVHPSNPATFVFTIDGQIIGDTLQHPGNVGEWNEFLVQWHSDANQTIEICINNANTIAEGNDFAIDDIFFGAACVQADTIFVAAPPTSVFTTNDVCTTDEVDFINSSIANSGTITNSSWIFGDGFLSTEFSPSHLYASTGTYQVSLEVTNSFGCVGTSTSSVNINPPPSSNIITTDVLCFNSNDGTATVSGVAGSSPYTYIWDDGSSNATITNLSIGQYSVTITDANGCSTTNSTTIYQPTQIVTSAAPVNVSCFGSSDGEIDLDISGGTPPYSYTWNTGDHSQDINNLNPNTYQVTAVDANGCTVTDAGIITEPLEIVINPNSSDILCYGETSGVIDISVNGGVSPYQYNWNNLASTEDLSQLGAGIYVVTVTDNSGCSKIHSIEINEPNQLVVSLPSDFTHCNNNTEILASVSGGTTPYSYQWNTGGVGQSIIYQTNHTDTYSVTVTDANNCTAEDLIEITIVSVDMEAFANKDTVCPGDPVLVTTNIIGGIPPYTIYDNGTIVNFPVIVYPNGQENYTLQVVDACGNTADAIVDIYTHPIQPLSFSADILQGCPPLTVNFNQLNYSQNFEYVWTFDDNDENNLSLDYNPTHTFEQSGLYDITVQLTDSNGCKNQLTIEDMINVYPKPDAKFWVDEDVISFLDANIYFDNHSIDNLYNYWAFGDGDSSINVNPTHDYEFAGIYYPSLIVENEYGCLDTAIKKIEIQDEFTLYVPTAFTPDNDGINDGFRAVGHGIDLDNFFIAVYDRWGEMIWSSEDMFEFWIGNSKGREKTVQNGTYKWLVVCKDFKGIEHTKSGNVTVIR